MAEAPHSAVTVEQLRALIGERVRYLGRDWEIVEVLEDGPALVLQDLSQKVIQPDQHGEAHRRVPTAVTIPIFAPDGSALNPVFQSLDLVLPEEGDRGRTGAGPAEAPGAQGAGSREAREDNRSEADGP